MPQLVTHRTRRTGSAAAFVLLATACAHAPSQPVRPEAAPPAARAPAPAIDEGAVLASLRASAADLLAAQGEALWGAWTQGTDPDLDAPYAGREGLLDPSSLGLVRKAQGRASGDEARALDHLALWLAREQVGDAATEAADAQVAAVASARVTEGGDERPFVAVPGWLAGESDRARRDRIATASLAAVASQAAASVALRAAYDRAARSLGYAGALDLALHLRRTEATELQKLATSVLEATEATQVARIDAASRRVLEVPASELHRSDLPRMLAGSSFHPRLPRGGALPALERTLAGLGLQLRGTGVTLLEGATPGKDPRAACIPVRVPGDVRLSVLPATSDWAPLFREAACALRLSLVKDEGLAFGLLGPGVSGEAFATLLGDLVRNPEWLKEQGALAGGEIDDWRDGSATLELLRVRLAAARVLTELDGGGAGPWRTWQARALGISISEAESVQAPLEADAFLADADRLRGMVLAAQLQAHLRKTYGRTWWHEKAAGAELRGWMARGSGIDPSELARAAGQPDLDPAPLAAELGSPSE